MEKGISLLSEALSAGRLGEGSGAGKHSNIHSYAPSGAQREGWVSVLFPGFHFPGSLKQESGPPGANILHSFAVVDKD